MEGKGLREGKYTYRCILTNDYTATDREIVEFYNKRGGKERIFDDMNKQNKGMKEFGLRETSQIKAFVFKFISVPAKWMKKARQYVLNIYTENKAYSENFKIEFG